MISGMVIATPTNMHTWLRSGAGAGQIVMVLGDLTYGNMLMPIPILPHRKMPNESQRGAPPLPVGKAAEQQEHWPYPARAERLLKLAGKS